MQARSPSPTRLLALLLALAAAGAEPAVLPNGDFERDGGWELQLRGGATGDMVRERLPDGGHALRLTKTNAVGALVVRTAAPVALAAGVRYRFRGRYRADEAPVSALLLFRIGPRDGALAYHSIDRSAGWTSQSLIVSSPPGQWSTRVGHYQLTEPGSVDLHVVLWGNPTTVWLDDLEVTDQPFRLPRNEVEPALPYSAEQVAARLAERGMSTGRVETRDGRTQLMIDGQTAAPIFYKAQPYGVTGYNDQFAAAGIDLATVTIRFGTLKNEAGVWTGPGRYDFARMERDLELSLRKNPNAKLICDLALYSYPEWGAEHPDEVWVNDRGERGYGWWGNLEGFTGDLAAVAKPNQVLWYYPSYQSQVWRDELAAALRAAIAHLRGTPYWKAVVGFFLSGGHDGQFVPTSQYDLSPATVTRFRTWLAARYGDIARLNAAWGTAYETFAAVPVPAPRPARSGMEQEPPHRAPGPERDYDAFRYEQTWTLRDEFAKVLKEAAGKPVFTVTYGSPGDHFAEEFTRCRWLEAAGAMSYYPYRAPGYASELVPYDSFALHGKLFFQELDLRSWVGSVYGDEVYQAYIGAGLTPDTWRAVHRKLVGISLAGDHGCWYYDMHCYFADPAIMAQIKDTRELAERLRAAPRGSFRPDVILVRTGNPSPYHGPPASSVIGGEWFQRMELTTSGVPFATHLLDDVLATPSLQQARVYVFGQNVFLTDAQRAGIERLLKSDGRTLVFLHDTGYLDERGKSLEALSKLVGMTVGTEEKYARLTALMESEPAAWTAGTRPFCGLSELLMAAMNLTGSSSFSGRYQPFWIDDPQATVLARYAEDGRAAIAVKKLPTEPDSTAE